MAQLLKGAPVAAALCEGLKTDIEQLKGAGKEPTLCIVRAGEREDDVAYERAILKRFQKLGLGVRVTALAADATTQQAKDAVACAAADARVHGILVMRPLPRHMDEQAVLAALPAEKDVDGVTSGAMAAVYAGRGAGYPPCTAQACMEVLDHYGIDPAGKEAVVVGRSLVIGKPMAMLLMGRNATVTVCHTKTRDVKAHCREADILVAAAGVRSMITDDFVKAGAVVLDVGIHVADDGSLAGDAALREDGDTLFTPVPAGVGAVTTAVLAKHVVKAAKEQ